MSWPAEPGPREKKIMSWPAELSRREKKVCHGQAPPALRKEKYVMASGPGGQIVWDARWNTEIVEMLVKASDSLGFLASGRSAPAGRPAKKKVCHGPSWARRCEKKVCHGQPSPATAKRTYVMAAGRWPREGNTTTYLFGAKNYVMAMA